MVIIMIGMRSPTRMLSGIDTDEIREAWVSYSDSGQRQEERGGAAASPRTSKKSRDVRIGTRLKNPGGSIMDMVRRQ